LKGRGSEYAAVGHVARAPSYRAGPPVTPTRAWEVARTVVAPPSSAAKCLWGVFVWGVGVLF